MRRVICLSAGVPLAIAMAGPARAQQTPAPTSDSVRLGALHQQAVAGDPRQRQFTLLAKQTELRLSNLSAERLPVVSAEAQAQYQSDVFTPPEQPGGGTLFPSPSNDTSTRRNSDERSRNPLHA